MKIGFEGVYLLSLGALGAYSSPGYTLDLLPSFVTDLLNHTHFQITINWLLVILCSTLPV
jgi:hypothetical protein